MTAKKKISVEEFDRLFDEGEEDIMDYLDLDAAVLVNPPKDEYECISINVPTWIVEGINKQATHLSIDKSELILRWIQNGLKQKG